MSRQSLTTEEFIRRSRVVHGDKYDYSEVDYVNNATKVRIICPLHGVFEQTPAKHMEGRGCPHIECVNERRAKTSMSHYGVEHPAQADEVMAKMKTTSVQHYGVPNPMQSAVVQEKVKTTVREKYHVDYTCQADKVKAKRKKTVNKRYGGNSPMCAEAVRQKARVTMLARYGVAYAMQSPVIVEKMRNTMKHLYGVENAMQSDMIIQRLRNTVQKKYGVSQVLQSDLVQKKRANICLYRYGVRSPLSNADIRRKSAETMIAKYGVVNPMQSSGVKHKLQKTSLQKYGAPNPMQNEDVKQKVIATKFANGTFGKSETEDALYGVLCGAFGYDDVIRQYVSDQYPFACDFYIKSRGLYIEFNGYWTHGGHWFDAASEKDAEMLCEYEKSACESEHYANAVSTWTGRDVRKRQAAAQSGLNYVVFWDSKLRDADLWFALGCPDGRDWEKEYSWVPEVMMIGQ